MIYRQRKVSQVFVGTILFLVSAVLISTLISVPYRITTFAEIFPKEKWMLSVGNNGQIISSVVDYSKGQTTEYKITQFERGEYVNVSFKKFLDGKRTITAGDTIVSMLSSNVKQQIIEATGELNVALANLTSQSSAQKKPLVEEAESRLKYVEEKIIEQTVLVERTKQLFDKKFASQQEYELQKWTLDLLNIEMKIYSAQIENLKTGVKPEELDLLKSQINSIKNRVSYLNEMEKQLVIVSQISGSVVASVSPDTLLSAINSNQLVLALPIKISDLPEFKKLTNVDIYLKQNEKDYKAKIISFEKEVKLINQQQIVMAYLLIENTDQDLFSGMITETEVNVKQTTLFGLIKKYISN